MSRIQYLEMLFGITVISYVLSLVLGYILGKREVLGVGWFADHKKSLIDPFTLRLHLWLDRHKVASIRQRSGGKLFLLICANNLLVASVRILYGVIFFIPFGIIIWSGLAQGVAYSRISGVRPSAVLLAGLFEFGAYLVAGVAGIDLGLSLVSLIIAGGAGALATALGEIALLYSIIVTLLLGGAAVETRFVIKRASPHGILSGMDQLDMDTLRSSLAKALENQPDAGQLDMDKLRDDLLKLMADQPEEE